MSVLDRRRKDAGAGTPAGSGSGKGAGTGSHTTDLSQHFEMGQLFRYALPSIVMMVFSSIYGIVDGLFISNFAGKTAFAAVNLIMPFIMVLSSCGFMFGTGGSALIAKIMGEGDNRRANAYFSLVVYVGVGVGIAFAILGASVMEPVARALGAANSEGASEEMIADCVLYGRISMISLPAFMLQYMFQSMFITAGKPRMGLGVTVASGVTNMVLDALFVGVFGWGIVGAAVATNISEFIGGLTPLVYFSRPNTSLLRLGRAQGGIRVVGAIAANGSSEMVSNIAQSVVSMVYNWQLIRMIGEDGVSAYGVIAYAGFIFVGVFMGYNVGVAPLMSYNYGAKNRTEMQSLARKSIAFQAIAGLTMLVLSHLFARPISTIFVGYDQELCDLTTHAFSIYAFAFLLMGFSTYASSLFTSLNNGKVSALISFLHTLVFECGSVLILPALFGPEAIWYSVVVAEIVTLAVSTVLFFWLAPNYGYLPDRKKDRHDALSAGDTGKEDQAAEGELADAPGLGDADASASGQEADGGAARESGEVGEQE